MEATTTLPRFCMIQSNYNNEYLQLLHTTSDVLQFGGTNNILHTRFEMVPATTGGGLYHIRSMLNNNFLAHLGDGRLLITAVASEPEEDQQSTTCTLFKPVWVNNPGGHDNNKNIRLLHVKTGDYACLLKVGSPFTYDFLYTAFPTADISGCDVYTIVNWEEKLTALVAEIGEIRESLASERVERKALAERLAVSEIILNLKKTNLSEGGSSTNKYPWMNDSPVSYCNAVTFKDLEVYEKFESESTRITIIDISWPSRCREDDTTNIRRNYMQQGMLDGRSVCWVVNVAGLPNNEMARFDPAIWGLLNKSGTSYAVSRSASMELLKISS